MCLSVTGLHLLLLERVEVLPDGMEIFIEFWLY